MWNEIDHGELFFEMTKPIESIYKSDSTYKLRNQSVKPSNRNRNNYINRMTKMKVANEFHNTAGYLNMTMTGN